MRTDPEPDQTFGAFLGEHAIPARHPRRPTLSFLSKSERRMTWILFEKGKRLVRLLLDFLWQVVVTLPELRAGEVLHSSLQRPASKSRSAMAARSPAGL